MDSSLPCISHIASFRQNNLIAWRGCPRCLHLKTKRALNSLLLLPYYYYYSQRKKSQCILSERALTPYYLSAICGTHLVLISQECSPLDQTSTFYIGTLPWFITKSPTVYQPGREIGWPYGQNLTVMNSILTGIKSPIDRNKNGIPKLKSWK